MTQNHRIVPRLQTGYILDNAGFFSIGIPEAGVNLIPNPEMNVENGVAEGYFTTDANFNPPPYVVDTADKQRGLASLRIDNAVFGDGICARVGTGYQTETTATVSFDHKGMGQYNAIIADQTTGVFSRYEFSGAANWVRHNFTFTTPATLNGAPTICVGLVDPGPQTFNVDGYQYEHAATASTFISGNGGDEYGWTGFPHGSASYRTGDAIGGRIASLKSLGLDVLTFAGLGLPTPDIDLQGYTSNIGSLVAGITTEAREITIAGIVCEKGICDLLCSRSKISSAIDPYGIGCSPPITLYFQPTDCCGAPCGECLQLSVYYDGGMEGTIQSLYREDVAIDFIAPDPYAYACQDDIATLSLRETLSTNFLIGQGPTGTWYNVDDIESTLILAPGANPPASEISSMLIAPDGILYMAGLIGVQNGIVYDPEGIVGWDGNNLVNIAQVSVEVRDMAVSPDGYLYVASGAGPIVGPNNTINSRGLARFNLRTRVWEDVGGAVAGNVLSVAVGYNGGGVVFGGDFDNVIANPTNVAIAANNIAAWYPDTGVISAIGPGLGSFGGDSIYTIGISPADGSIWAGGRFGNGPDPFADIHNISRYNDGAWEYIDVPLLTSAGGSFKNQADNAWVNDVTFDGARVYIGGRFEHGTRWVIFSPPALNPLNHVAFLDSSYGQTWQNMGSGVAEPLASGTYQPEVYDIEFSNGELYVAGLFREAGDDATGTTEALGTAIWDGSKWVSTGIEPEPLTATNGAEYYVGNTVAVGSAYQYSTTGAGNSELPVASPQSSIFWGGPWYDRQAGNTQGVTLVPTVNTLDLGCSSEVYPIIEIKGAMTITGIVNHSTGKRIDFREKADDAPNTIGSDETITINLAGAQKTIRDQTGANRHALLSPGTILGAFYLKPGINRIQILGDLADTEPGSITIRYRRRFISADAVRTDCC